MTSGFGIGALYERYIAALGAEPWVDEPGLTDAELAATEAELGFALPGDLVELLSIHNGGMLLDSLDWVPCRYLPREVKGWPDDLRSSLILYRTVLVIPSEKCIPIASSGQFGMLYDLEQCPGRILYWDVLSQWSVCEVSRSLAELIEHLTMLAAAGRMFVGENPFPQPRESSDQIPFRGLGLAPGDQPEQFEQQP